MYLDEAEVEYDAESGTVKMPVVAAGSYTLLMGEKKLLKVVVVKQRVKAQKPLIVQQLQDGSIAVPKNARVQVSGLN